MPDAVRVEAHGATVWCNKKLDALRRTDCLCLNCGRARSCPVAKTLFAVCVNNNLALAVTRCPVWEKKDA